MELHALACQTATTVCINTRTRHKVWGIPHSLGRTCSCMFNLWLMEFVRVLNIHVVINEVCGCTDAFPFKIELSMWFVTGRIVRRHYIVARHIKAENKFQFIWTSYNLSSVLWEKIWYQYQRRMDTTHYKWYRFYSVYIAVYSDTPPWTSQH